MTRKRPLLSDEDVALWQHVTRNVKRTATGVSGAATPPIPPAATKSRLLPRQPSPRAAQPELVIGASAGIDRRTARRFSRGEMAIEAKLDLHGRTVAEAEAEVRRFVCAAAATGLRCVLIVTGKGRPQSGSMSGTATGRIRAEAMHWLNRPALRSVILAVREASPHQGGSGALCVFLKRRRAR